MSLDFPTRVALVYDWVNTPYGGAERVLTALHKIFPDAPLYTSVYDKEVANWAKDFDIRTSYLQELPLAKQAHRELLPLMPSVFEHLHLQQYELIISITSAEAKGVNIHRNALHICYLLTPTRYLWSHTHEYQTGLLAPLKALMFSKLRAWDFKAAQKPDVIIPISKLVAHRTKKYYQRETAPVIYPPFNLEHKVDKQEKTFRDLKDYFLIVSRLVGYKKVELCVYACIQLQKQMVLVGDGPDSARIEKLISQKDPHHKYIHWFRRLSDDDLQQAYSASKALLLPAEEDFGITALEAQAFGKPVIVYQHSGAAEVVLENTTGIHFSEQTIEALSTAILETEKKVWKTDVIKSHATQYNEQAFMDQFRKAVTTAWQQHKKG